ncbi:MAG: hypothetical protein JWQ66_969 [Mucilaginibacter sp.]|nr:hypothetical protein [Mucilaginibacter sp.]
MKLQVIQDSKGKATGVFIPYSEWKVLKKRYKELEALENDEPNKEQILQGIREAVEEMKLIKAGKLKGRAVQELLDEI